MYKIFWQERPVPHDYKAIGINEHFPEMSTVDYLMQMAFDSAIREFDIKLKSYLIKNLTELGIKFKNDIEFMELVKSRITKISTEDSPNHVMLFLDYMDEYDPGQLVGQVNTNTSVFYHKNRINVRIG